MKNTGTLELAARGNREIVMTRDFDGPRALVFDALTKPALVQRWLLGPSGWSMPVCEIDLQVGGRFRFVWRHRDGREMGMGGVYREVAPPERLIHTELFDEDSKSRTPSGASQRYPMTSDLDLLTLSDIALV